ncbi:MAG: hypothetical protein AAF378_10240 [Cyanobacteria bacterium P01_A01_bin.84]
MSEAVESKKSSAFSKVKQTLIGVVIAILAGAGIFGIGWWQGSNKANSQQNIGDRQVTLLETQLDQAKSQIEQTKNYAYLMQARAELYHTAVDLDRRNFGTANTRLQEAAIALGKVKDINSTIDTTKVSSLQKEISQMNINVAVNLEEQRQKVLGFVNKLNRVIPEDLEAVTATEPNTKQN